MGSPGHGIPLPAPFPCSGTSTPTTSPWLSYPPACNTPCPRHPPSRSLPLPIPRHPLLTPSPFRVTPRRRPGGWHTAGTADSRVLNVAQLPVLAHGECQAALRGRLKESELCTAPLRSGVGACEVSGARGAWGHPPGWGSRRSFGPTGRLRRAPGLPDRRLLGAGGGDHPIPRLRPHRPARPLHPRLALRRLDPQGHEDGLSRAAGGWRGGTPLPAPPMPIKGVEPASVCVAAGPRRTGQHCTRWHTFI